MGPSSDASNTETTISEGGLWTRWTTRLAGVRWRGGLILAASLLGCQSMAASRQITAPVALVLPDGLEEARRSFLQGMQLGEQSVRSCGAEPAGMVTHGVGQNDDPAALFSKDGQDRLLVPPLVVAPYAADVRRYGRLTDLGETRVLLAHQRGSSLSTLGGLDNQGRLWPLLPPRIDDLRALANDAIARGWKRVLVVSDPSSLEGDQATAFVELFEGLGGTVLSYTQQKVQELSGRNPEALALFEKDLDWLGPDALALAAPPRGKVAQWLRRRQAEKLGGARPTWIWLNSSSQAASITPQPWPQLVLKTSAHGPGWPRFAESFGQRWGYRPNLIAAAGYETARVLALTVAGPVPLASDGTRDPLAWIDPSADPLPLCQAFAARRKGGSTRVEGVASDFSLRPGQAPSGVADTRFMAAQ